MRAKRVDVLDIFVSGELGGEEAQISLIDGRIVITANGKRFEDPVPTDVAEKIISILEDWLAEGMLK